MFEGVWVKGFCDFGVVKEGILKDIVGIVVFRKNLRFDFLPASESIKNFTKYSVYHTKGVKVLEDKFSAHLFMKFENRDKLMVNHGKIIFQSGECGTLIEQAKKDGCLKIISES